MKESLNLKTKFNKITTSKSKYESGFLYFYLDDNDKIVYIFNALNCHILKYKNTELTEFSFTADTNNVKIYYNTSLSNIFNTFAKEVIKILNNTIKSAKTELEIIKQSNINLENNFLEYLI